MSKQIVTVQDDAMFCYTENVHIPKGAEILIDTSADIALGKIIAVELIKTGKIFFRKLAQIGGKKYLIPLNTKHPKIKLNSRFKVVGVAVAVYQNLCSNEQHINERGWQ